MRLFNTAGPRKSNIHYTLPSLNRFSLDDVLALIAEEKYFVLHAPRHIGKTTCLLALVDHLNRAGEYRAVYVNVEIGQSAREDMAAALASGVLTKGSQRWRAGTQGVRPGPRPGGSNGVLALAVSTSPSNHPNAQRIVVEVKVIGRPREKRSAETAIREGIEQTAAYMQQCHPDEDDSQSGSYEIMGRKDYWT